MRLTRMTGPKAEQIIVVAERQGDRRQAASLELSHRILPTGEAVADIGGELDIATADTAVSYLTQLIDRHPGPVIADLTALRFCDARGLSALLRIARYAEQGDHKFRRARNAATARGPTVSATCRAFAAAREACSPLQRPTLATQAGPSVRSTWYTPRSSSARPLTATPYRACRWAAMRSRVGLAAIRRRATSRAVLVIAARRGRARG